MASVELVVRLFFLFLLAAGAFLPTLEQPHQLIAEATALAAVREWGVRYLAVEFGLSKIRVNAISAGPVRTLSASAVKGLSALRRWTEEVSPLRQNITLQDVGNTAVYLASDLSRMVTGNVIYVDSGTHVLAAQVGAIEHRQQ